MCFIYEDMATATVAAALENILGHMKSTDLVHWEQLPNALEIGEQRFPDGGACFTGSVVEYKGVFHIYYTGFHPGYPEGREQILHATSTDLIHFTKDPGYVPVLYPDGKTYRLFNDWRDPNVFWNEEDQMFCMLVTANTGNKSIPYIRSGVTAIAKSADLKEWTLEAPIYQPFSYPAHEVNEIYQIGDWWYLMFTDFKGHTEYRMSRNPKGPWTCPRFPEVDMSTHFYAGKSLSDGKRRLVFGWCGTLLNGIDDRLIQWGGNMLTPRELRQTENGELRFVYPEEFYNLLNLKPITAKSRYGQWEITNGSASCESMYQFSAAVIPDSKGDWALRLKMDCLCGTGKLGIAVNCDEDMSKCYYLNLDTGKNQFEITHFSFIDDDQACQDQMQNIARPLVTQGMGSIEVYEMLVIKKEQIVEIFINDGITATLRCSEIPDGDTALFCEYVDAKFTEIEFNKI